MKPRGCLVSTPDGEIRFFTELAEVRHLDTSEDASNCENIAILVDSYMCLIADSPLTVRRGQKSKRVFLKFRKWLLTRPLTVSIPYLSKLAYKLLNSCSQTGLDAYTGTLIPELLKLPISREYLEWKKSGDASLLRYLLTFLFMGKKLDYEDPNFGATALCGWLEVEERLSRHQLPPDLTADLAAIMEQLIGDFSFDGDLRPKFGPGAVAESGVWGSIVKANSLRYHPRIDALLFPKPGRLAGGKVENGFHPEKVLPDPSRWNKDDVWSTDTAKWLSVPKDMTKARSICKEPNTFMFAQQAVLDQVKRAFRDGVMRRFVNLSDQARNRKLAEYGSLTGEIDTIDLSSASDSVMWDLVKAVMPLGYLRPLWLTRTSKVQLPDGTIFRVQKCAPMGSALCFPTQCLIFTSIALLAVFRYLEGKAVDDLTRIDPRWTRDFSSSLRAIANEPGYYAHGRSEQKVNPIAVYGDDIAVDTRVTPGLIHLLRLFGFEVNDDKSYQGGNPFRESCGGYYFGGEDVTPFMLRVKRVRGGSYAPAVASAVASCNLAGDRGFRHLRSYLMHRALEWCPAIPFVRPTDTMAMAIRTQPEDQRPRINTHLPRRYNKYLQRDEWECMALRQKEYREASEDQRDPHERYRYLAWWVSRTDDLDPDPYGTEIVRYDSRDTRLCRRWIPAE